MADLDQIRMRLADWIAGKYSLAEFEDWFVPATWNIQGSDELVNLVDEIELNLSEYSGGYLSRQGLIDAMTSALAAVSPTQVIVWEPSPKLMNVPVLAIVNSQWSFLQVSLG